MHEKSLQGLCREECFFNFNSTPACSEKDVRPDISLTSAQQTIRGTNPAVFWSAPSLLLINEAAPFLFH